MPDVTPAFNNNQVLFLLFRQRVVFNFFFVTAVVSSMLREVQSFFLKNLFAGSYRISEFIDLFFFFS